MATLAAAVYFHFPQYYDLFARREFSYEGKTYYTHNHLLKNFEGADGMKPVTSLRPASTSSPPPSATANG